MHPAVTSVVCEECYVRSITFDNGENGSLDRVPYLNFGIFKKIQDPTIFATVHDFFDTITGSSAADLDPVFVDEKCTQSAQGDE